MSDNHPPHVLRMIAERDDLGVKLEKLSNFLDERGMQIDTADFNLLVAQKFAMLTYYNILTIRLSKV